jgi:hypothetical protein
MRLWMWIKTLYRKYPPPWSSLGAERWYERVTKEAEEAPDAE